MADAILSVPMFPLVQCDKLIWDDDRNDLYSAWLRWAKW
jgi:hypothetical protein